MATRRVVTGIEGGAFGGSSRTEQRPRSRTLCSRNCGPYRQTTTSATHPSRATKRSRDHPALFAGASSRSRPMKTTGG